MIEIDWSRALADALARGEAAVLITQLSERGSSPRSTGAKMLVTQERQYDSLGGGNLEFKAIEHARSMLEHADEDLVELCYTLSGQLGQCCGGEVRVLFERFNAQLPQLYLFGAGHIAQALVPMLDKLPIRPYWIDDREDLFPETIPKGVTVIDKAPLDVAENLPKNAWVLIMTHDHQLDFDLVKAILERDSTAYLGMIGSETKALKFRQRLEQRGFDQTYIDRLHSPIGLMNLKTKRPAEIAVSIAADLITRYQQI